MSYYIIPIFILLVLIIPFLNKKKIYKAFIDGCYEGLSLLYKIFPFILSMIFLSNILIGSNILQGIFKKIDIIPYEIIIQILFKIISNNASLSIMMDIYKKYGVDSNIGILSSIIQNSSDTLIYILYLYLGIVNINKSKKIFILSLLTYIISMIIIIILF